MHSAPETSQEGSAVNSSREEAMGTRTLRVLLVGESLQSSPYLAKRLQSEKCECSLAGSYQEARSLLGSNSFDVVPCPMRWRNQNFSPLIDLLEGSGVTLFYSYGVEEGCWWLPAVWHGERCFGSSVFRPSEFVSVLDEAIEEGRLVGCRARDARQAAVHSSPPSTNL
jgi:hypothetical protein